MIGDFIRDNVLQSIRENDSVFSLIADEVTDISNKVLSLCLTHVSVSPTIQIREIFIDFVQLDGITVNLFAKALLETLRRRRIDLTKCRGQCYVGATAMSSEKIGVQRRIRDHSATALYTHCNSHVLNLSIASFCKLPWIRNMIDNVKEISLFFGNSPKRQRVLETLMDHHQK